MQEEYKITKKRTTNELETEDNTPSTKRVLLYGWDGSAKTRIKVDASGYLGVTI